MAKRFSFCGAILILACAWGQAEGNLRKVTLAPLWSPQAQFAGYYVALDKGIYRSHGLDVTIVRGGPDVFPARLLAEGKADFGILWLSAAIRERSLGIPLVNIAQMSQRSALILVAKKSSGIRFPADMNGKKISYWDGLLQIQPKAFIKKFNLKVTVLPQTYSVNLFLRGGVDVISAMWYNEYHTLLNSGLDREELVVFSYDKYGLDFPEDGIYATENGAVQDPELCRLFVRASLEGWRYAFTHESEALDVVLNRMKAAGLPANRIHQRWMLGKIKELMMPKGGGNTLGVLDGKDYERVAGELLKCGEITSVPDLAQFCQPPQP